MKKILRRMRSAEWGVRAPHSYSMALTLVQIHHKGVQRTPDDMPPTRRVHLIEPPPIPLRMVVNDRLAMSIPDKQIAEAWITACLKKGIIPRKFVNKYTTMNDLFGMVEAAIGGDYDKVEDCFKENTEGDNNYYVADVSSLYKQPYWPLSSALLRELMDLKLFDDMISPMQSAMWEEADHIKGTDELDKDEVLKRLSKEDWAQNWFARVNSEWMRPSKPRSVREAAEWFKRKGAKKESIEIAKRAVAISEEAELIMNHPEMGMVSRGYRCFIVWTRNNEELMNRMDGILESVEESGHSPIILTSIRGGRIVRKSGEALARRITRLNERVIEWLNDVGKLNTGVKDTVAWIA